MSLELEIDLSKNKIENQENENIIMKILEKSGFVITKDISELNGIMIPRDLLINDEKYDIVKEYLVKLKKHKMFSSTFLTSLHKDADKKQKWPLLNLVRQILKVNHFRMNPIRKSAGKTKLGKKKYIRYFLIEKLKKTEEINELVA
tara:strand:+ start:1213 stop:1650 length:438 start_codon:yes stop_codon:yes gene_type:complete